MKRICGYSYSYDDPRYLSDTEEINVNLDAIITIDDSGNWEYEDEDYPWAKNPRNSRDRWWTDSDLYPTLLLASHIDVAEYTDELLEPLLPYAAGKYHIKGDVHLVFNVEGVEMYEEFLGKDREGDLVFDTDYYTDNAEINFQYGQSSIDNFEIEKL